MNTKNNIFHYATSELSQDAFLCWLFSFTLKDVDNEPVLKTCAEDFLKQFVPELEDENEIWLSNEPERQYKSIDILLTVNDKYKIIIEDKTYTKEHDNQLERYFDIVKSDFTNYVVKSVYFKIGFQSDTSAVERAGYMASTTHWRKISVECSRIMDMFQINQAVFMACGFITTYIEHAMEQCMTCIYNASLVTAK